MLKTLLMQWVGCIINCEIAVLLPTFCSLLPCAQTCLSLLHRTSVANCGFTSPILICSTALDVKY